MTLKFFFQGRVGLCDDQLPSEASSESLSNFSNEFHGHGNA